jgi:peptidoglycan/xylan/chitin deacetylase (PgdA/CDA1 family)
LAQRNGDLIDAEVVSGHGVANHTLDHSSLSGVGKEAFFREVLETERILGDRGTKCLRPPYGATDAYTRAYLSELGYRLVMWDIDTVDWRRPGVGAIIEEATSKAFPGAVVLFHDGGGDRSQTVEALESVLRELSRRGYAFAPVCRR